MGCETCGDKKPACDKGFTKAALEIKNPSQLVEFRKIVVPASLGDDTAVPPVVGKYCNAILYYEANDQVYLYSSDGIPTKITVDVEALKKQIKDLQDGLANEASTRSAADLEIWQEIEAIEASSDVVDVVGTYAELQQYDTSKLHDNDLIKVLADETHDDAITYYRWNDTTDTFSYVGAEGPYYTVSETDVLLSGKQDTLIAGTNIQIAADGKTISATDTTYSAFTGTDGTAVGTSGLVPAPATTDAGKYLNANGTWVDASYSVFTNNVDGLTPAPHNSFSFRQYLLDNATWATQIAEYAPSIASNGTDLTVTYKTSNGMNEGTIKTYSNLAMTGATSSANGKIGFVPRPLIADRDKFLKGDGTWGDAGASITTFYIGGVPGSQSTSAIYKESTLTTAIRASDLNTALASGGVRICQMASGDAKNYYDVMSYSAADGYYTISQYHNDLTLHTFAFDSTYTIEWLNSEVQAKLTAGSNININGNTISATDTTYSDFTGATSSVAGAHGLVPAPTTSDPDKYLKGDGTWASLPAANNISSNDWSALWQ